MNFKKIIPIACSTCLMTVAPLLGSCGSSDFSSSWDVNHQKQFHAKYKPRNYLVVKDATELTNLYFDDIAKHPRIFADDLIMYVVNEPDGSILSNVYKMSVNVKNQNKEKHLISFDMYLEFVHNGQHEKIDTQWTNVLLECDEEPKWIPGYGRELLLNPHDFQTTSEDWSVTVKEEIVGVGTKEVNYSKNYTFVDDPLECLYSLRAPYMYYLQNVSIEGEEHE